MEIAVSYPWALPHSHYCACLLRLAHFWFCSTLTRLLFPMCVTEDGVAAGWTGITAGATAAQRLPVSRYGHAESRSRGELTPICMCRLPWKPQKCPVTRSRYNCIGDKTANCVFRMRIMDVNYNFFSVFPLETGAAESVSRLQQLSHLCPHQPQIGRFAFFYRHTSL